MQKTDRWTPAACGYPGLFAAKTRQENVRTVTRNPIDAMSFETEAECLAWCKQYPWPVFEPRSIACGH